MVLPVMMTDIDSTEATDCPDRSTHMSTRMIARPQRIEVITRNECRGRRRWSAEEKRDRVKNDFGRRRPSYAQGERAVTRDRPGRRRTRSRGGGTRSGRVRR